MKKIFKFALLFAAACMLTTGFTACGDDNEEIKDDVYKDRSYGNQAVDACANVVAKFEAANGVIANASLTSDQEAYLRDVGSNADNRRHKNEEDPGHDALRPGGHGRVGGVVFHSDAPYVSRLCPD